MSADNGTMAANIEIAQMWTLNDDRQSVKLSLPPLPLHGLPEPLRVTIDFEADMVEDNVRNNSPDLMEKVSYRHFVDL